MICASEQSVIVLDKIYGKKATMEAAEEFEAQHAAEYADVILYFKNGRLREEY